MKCFGRNYLFKNITRILDSSFPSNEILDERKVVDERIKELVTKGTPMNLIYFRIYFVDEEIIDIYNPFLHKSNISSPNGNQFKYELKKARILWDSRRRNKGI